MTLLKIKQKPESNGADTRQFCPQHALIHAHTRESRFGIFVAARGVPLKHISTDQRKADIIHGDLTRQ